MNPSWPACGSAQLRRDGTLAALTGGYHAAFLGGGSFALAAAVAGATLLRAGVPGAAHAAEEALGAFAASEAD